MQKEFRPKVVRIFFNIFSKFTTLKKTKNSFRLKNILKLHSLLQSISLSIPAKNQMKITCFDCFLKKLGSSEGYHVFCCHYSCRILSYYREVGALSLCEAVPADLAVLAVPTPTHSACWVDRLGCCDHPRMVWAGEPVVVAAAPPISGHRGRRRGKKKTKKFCFLLPSSAPTRGFSCNLFRQMAGVFRGGVLRPLLAEWGFG